MTAFDEIFDEANNCSQSSGSMPRQKRGRATSIADSGLSPPAPDTNAEMQAADMTKPFLSVPAKKKANSTPETNRVAPSSSLIPRKRGRPATIHEQTLLGVQDANNSDGQRLRENHSQSAIGTGRVDRLSHESHVPAINAVLLSIVAGWKMRQRWHRAEKALVLQAKAICRAFSDGDKDAANAAYAKISKGEFVSEELAMALTPFLPAIERFEAERKAIEKDLKKRSKTVPTYEWAMSVRGFGELNFVAILGECCVHQEDGTMRGVGDYRTVSALWKRMGVALVEGERQRRVADAELAILHGYNPSRRSVLFNVGECLIKAGGEFKALYDERKAYELARDAEIRPILAHRRAARYMTKRLLRKMYAQWRKETRGVSGDPDEIVLPVAAE